MIFKLFAVYRYCGEPWCRSVILQYLGLLSHILHAIQVIDEFCHQVCGHKSRLSDGLTLFSSHYTQLVGVRVYLGAAEAGPFPGVDTNQLRPRVMSSESLADLICFKV